jgi:hypothetical protein
LATALIAASVIPTIRAQATPLKILYPANTRMAP